MNWEPIPSPGYEIKNLQGTIRDSEIHLTWFWPKEIDFVYLYKASADDFPTVDELTASDLRLYTREEYKTNLGYIGKVEAFGKFGFRIFPCQKLDGELKIFRQENEDNLLFISGARAKIHFSISYKNRFLQGRKKVKMTIMTELPLDKELLCYLRKRDSVPISHEDGTWYPFVRDFPVGKTELPEFDIGKNDYIRILINQGSKSADLYELIAE
ncbi:hypothetical protein [Neobacillus sp. FSL H8-0543]|uniref:hypothetical protein n=1 Tax=Neobacillus sp. FSL H8-0543 TaxID=2954672 RepID=UPI003158015A